MSMRPGRIHGWLLLALVPHAAALAAAVAVPREAPTVEQVEETIQAMMRTVWDLSTPGQDDESSRGAAADIERFVLSDATLKEIESLRASLPGAVDAATGRIPLEALEPLERIMNREFCRLSAVMSHWSRDNRMPPLRLDLQGALDRLPAAPREAFEREIETILAEGRTDRTQMEADVRGCASTGLDDLPVFMERTMAVVAALAQLRDRLATAVNEAVRTGESAIIRNARTSPCPAPRSPTPGNPRPQLAMQDDIAGAYPALARNAGIEGTVRVRITIDESGCVVEASVFETSASDMLDEAAVHRALGQQYIPAEIDGKASTYSAILPVNYRLREQ